MIVNEVEFRKLFKNYLIFDEPLAKYTTFKIGGKAKYFIEAKSSEDLTKIIKGCNKCHLPYFILGGGSNLLISDNGFSGLIIKITSFGYQIKNNLLITKSGTPTAYVLEIALKNNLSGLEFLSGVPGTIGGAIYCNAHAYFLGNYLKEPKFVESVVKRIKVLTSSGEVIEIVGGNYSQKGNIILSAEFMLSKGVTNGAKKYIEEYRTFRKDKPYQMFPTPGSIFRNPQGKSAGLLIDQCGLKGKKIGGAQISPKHGNFIVNLGNAKSRDVLQLIKLARESVRSKFGIELEEEICYLNSDR